MPIAPYNYATGGAAAGTKTSAPAAPAKPTSGGIAPYNYATGGADPAVVNPVIAKYQTDLAASKADAAEENSAGGIFKNTLSDIGSRLLSVPVNFAKGLASSYSNAATAIPNDIKTAASEFQRDDVQNPNGSESLGSEFKSAADLVKGGGRAAGDFAGAVFAPISSAIGAAVQATGAQSLLDHTGQEVANGSGITDIPAFQKFAMQHPNAGDDFGRLLNVLLGGEELGDATKTATDAKAVATRIVTDAAHPAESATASNLASAIKKVQVQGGDTSEVPVEFQNKYTAPHDLPTINAGTTPKSLLPTIQIGDEPPVISKQLGSLRYEPISDAEPAIKTADAPINAEVKNPALDVAPPPVPDSSVGTVSSVADEINEKLVARGLDALPDEELAKFNSITKADQIVKVSSLLDNDPEKAVQAALGHINVPEGIHPQVLFNSVANAAEESGNMKLMADLAKSPHATARSEAAQTMSAAGFNKDAENTVSNLERIRNMKTKSVDTKVIEKAQRAARSQGAKVELSKEDLQWDKFLNSIAC